jgi:hypothetical protein
MIERRVETLFIVFIDQRDDQRVELTFPGSVFQARAGACISFGQLDQGLDAGG